MMLFRVVEDDDNAALTTIADGRMIATMDLDGIEMRGTEKSEMDWHVMAKKE